MVRTYQNCCPCIWQVREILTEGEGSSKRAIGARLADGRVFRGRSIVSNATRWDTFEKLMGGEEALPPSEKAFRQRYKKSPSFLSVHMGVKAHAVPAGTRQGFEQIEYMIPSKFLKRDCDLLTQTCEIHATDSMARI